MDRENSRPIHNFHACEITMPGFTHTKWLPNEPGINMIEYSIWDALEHVANCRQNVRR